MLDAIGQAQAWTPTAEVTEHNGDVLPPDCDFFAPPPAEIGEVVTVHTSLRKQVQPRSTAVRLAISGSVGLLVAVGVAGILLLSSMNEPILLAGCGGGLGLVIGLILIPLTGFRHSCTYVGTRGLAKITCRNSRENIRVETLFLYASAAELRTSQTRMHHNGIYTGTQYQFNWTDQGGAKKLKLSGTYHSKEGRPKVKDAYHWATAAELAWSHHLLDLAQSALDEKGALVFRLAGSDFIGMGPGFVELHRKGQIDRLEMDDIDEVSLADGVFTVKRKGAAKGFLGIGRSGYFTFDYGTMANARVFLIALDQLMGLRFG